MHEPAIALAATPFDWAQRLHRHVADHGGARMRAMVLSPQDALAEDYDVLVADQATSFLTAGFVDALHAGQRRLLGVFDPDDARGKSELIELGADDVVARDTPPETFLRAVAALASTRLHPSTDLTTTSLAPTPPVEGDDFRRGPILAVAGTCGGVGATEVALGLSCALAAAGRRVVLVDADEVAPALAQRLSLPLYPNIRAAVDAVERRDGDLASCLVPAGLPGLAVLTGLPNPHDWCELRAGEVAAVVTRLAAAHEVVVVNAGPHLEDLAGAGGSGRHAVSRTLVAAADALVAVALGTPVGLGRLLSWAADLRALVPACSQSRLRVAVNRVPRGAFPRAELASEIIRCLPHVPLTFLPVDERVATAAWAGDLVATGPFTRAVDELAATLVPSPAPPSRRRWRGLAMGSRR